MDPYGSAASDVYHDLFDQGTYTGKGIFQVDAFYACLDRRVPEGRVLSHDLLEGSYLRAGLLGEVELTDGFPYQVRSYYARLNRWIRGDWQLLPWLFPGCRTAGEGVRKIPCPRWHGGSCWTTCAALSPPSLPWQPWCWGSAGAGQLWLPLAAPLSSLPPPICSCPGWTWPPGRGGRARGRYHSTVVAGLPGALLQTALQLLFLPYHAWVSACAVCTALWRMGVTGRDLLAWVTADQSGGAAATVCGPITGGSGFPPAVGLATFLLAELRIGSLAGAAVDGGSRRRLVDQPAQWKAGGTGPGGPGLPASPGHPDLALLCQLPPGGGPLAPAGQLAGEAGGGAGPPDLPPTNIGLALLSVMAAVDLDLLPQDQGAGLIRHVLNTVEGLEKWRGHLYNWYDTVSARPMAPRYISTVDSGNLCGSLIALAAGLEEWGEGELAARARALSGAMEFRPCTTPTAGCFSSAGRRAGPSHPRPL